MLHILLKVRKFQSQYSCKVFFSLFKERNKWNESCGIYRFSFNCSFSQWILIYLEKETGILALFSLFVKLRGEKPTVKISVKQKAMNWSISAADLEIIWNPRNHAQRCYILILTVCLIIQYFMIGAHWPVPVHSPQFCTQFTFHISWFQLKREISRTITFCRH